MEGNYIGNSPDFTQKITGIWKLNNIYQKVLKNSWNLSSPLKISLDANQYSSGSIWYDLTINSNNTTLYNTSYDSSNSGSLVFNGSTGYSSFTATSFNNLNNATIIAFIKRNSSQSDYAGIFVSRSSSTSGIFLRSNNSLGYIWNNSFFSNSSGITIPDNQWCMVALTISPTQGILYYNDTLTYTNTASHNTTTLDAIRLGRDDFGTRYFKGNISIVQFYNICLTANEILNIYNQFKGRYGL